MAIERVVPVGRAVAILSVLASGCFHTLWTFQPDIPSGFGIAAGPMASARTDVGTGAGWTAAMTIGGKYDASYNAWLADASQAAWGDVRNESELDPAAFFRRFHEIEMSRPTFNAFRRIEISRVSYPEQDGVPRAVDILRIAMDASFEDTPWMFQAGLAFHTGTGDMWGVGPRIGYGVGLFRERFELYILATGSLWLGEADDAFDVGAEADIRACLGFRM